MIMLKSGNFNFRTPSSKQHGRFNLPEAGETMKKKPKLTGHSLKSSFKRKRQEETVPAESALDKSDKVMDQGIKQRVYSPPSKKMRPLKKKDAQCSVEISSSGKDLVLGRKGIGKEASKVDERRNVKNIIQESSANVARYEDQDRLPVKQKLTVDDQSVGRDTNISVDDIQKKCDKRMKKKDVQCSEEISDAGKDLVLGGKGIGKEASKVDERRNVKNTIQENSANVVHYEDQDRIPVKQKLKVEDQSAVLDTNISVDNFQKKCAKWMKKKDVQRSEETCASGKDLMLGGKGIVKEASKVKERRNLKNTIQENSANVVHCEDQDRIPVKHMIKVEDQSSGRDTNISVDDIQKKCDKRMKKLVQKQKGQIEDFHRAWEDGFSILEADFMLEMAIVRSIFGKSSTTIEKLEILDSELAKKRAENNLQKDMTLKELEAEHQAARNEEIQKADIWLSEAKALVSGRLSSCSKAQSSGSQNEEVSRGYKSRTHIGGKDMMPIIQKRGENNDSNCGTAEDLAHNGLNENPSIDLKASQKNEGGIGRRKNEVGIISSDTQIPDIVEQIKHSGERVPCEMQSLELLDDIPLELPETVAKEIENDANPVNRSTNIPIEGMAEVDATDLRDAGNSGGDERISTNLPASGESVLGEVQSIELHGDVPEELPETIAEEIVNDANPVNRSTNIPIEGMAEVDATDVRDAGNSGGDERISPNLPASGESVLDEVQSVELHGDIPEELPETIAKENVDKANMVELSTSTPSEVSGEGDAINLPNDEHLTHPKRFGIDDMLKGIRIPAELAKTAAHEIVDSVNPVELSADIPIEGFGEGGAVHLRDAFLNQRNAADGTTTIDDLLLDGQELKTSEQTEAFQHCCPLLPLQVQEDQDAVSAELQLHDVGKINSSPSEVVTSELVDSAANSLSNIEPQACEDPAIETQSSSTTEVSTSKIVDNVITEQPPLKAQVREKSVFEDQVTLPIEVADLEIVDTAAPVSASEVVDTAETLQSTHELQEQVEPAMEIQSMPSIEATVSQNLSNAEEQVEDSILDIDVSNAGITGDSNPVQSHIDAPPIDSCSQLPSTDLECQNHNLESNSSEAVETVVLLDDSLSRLIEDVVHLSNSCDVRPENQSSPATRVQTSASFQNNAAAEGVSHLPSHQAAASNPLSLISDPLQNELGRILKETEALQKSHQEMMSGLKSECEKEIEEFIAEVRRKYQLKFDDAIAQFKLKNCELYQSRKKIVMNKLLADAFRFNCLNMRSTWPLPQQGSPSGSLQHHQQVRPTAPNPQNLFLAGQPMHQTSVSQATSFTPVTSRNVHPVPQVLTHSTRLGPNTNQNSAAQSVPHAMTFVTSRNGQPMHQRPPVPHATRLGPVTNQNFVAQSVKDAQQLAATTSRFRAMNSFLSTTIPRFGENIQSSPNFQASTPAAVSSTATAFDILSNLRNLQLLQQQQTLVAPQWPSNSQNFQDLGYSPSLSHHNLHSLQVLGQNHQNIGDVQGNWNSCGGAPTAIYLSDDD